jgi:hypothetical protein
MSDDQQQPPATVVPHAAFLMVWQLIRAIRVRDPALYEEFFRRLSELESSDIGLESKKSMELIMSLLRED